MSGTRRLPRTYDSGWTNINQGQTSAFSHSLGITGTDLTVALWFSDTARGIHQFGYGGLGIDGPKRMLGCHWHDLTDNTVEVTRHPHDTDIQQVRVLVVHGGPSQYDSLEDVGGWQPIAPGTTRTFSHNLDWKPEMLLVRGECFSPTVSGMGGIHHWFAGGNHGWIAGWQGTNVQNVTSNTLEVFRQPDDQICPQIRVRVWRQFRRVYLPLVMLSS